MHRLVLVLVFLVPAAHACDLVSEPPGPGAFYVWDTQADPVAVNVQQRNLGATCQLSNLNAADDDSFAWLEGGTIHLLDLADGTRKQISWSGDHPQDLALVDGALLVRENTGSGSDRVHNVWQIAQDGSMTLLFSTSEFGDLHGAFYVGNHEGITIIDVRTGDAVLSSTPGELGYEGDGEPRLIGTDGNFLVFEGPYPSQTLRIYDISNGHWRRVDIQSHSPWQQVADGHFFSAREGSMTIVALDSGAVSHAVMPNLPLLGAGGGHAILGSYSASSNAGPWQAATPDHEAALPLWPALLGLALVRLLRRVA